MSRRTWSGEAARKLREAAGLSPEEAAERLGSHRATVFAWEAGREPQLRFAVAMADLFQVPLDSLFVLHEDEPATADGARGTNQPAPISAGQG